MESVGTATISAFPTKRSKSRAGLVLTGGGARAAYQVGVVKAVRDLLGNPQYNPFPIVCGTSAQGVVIGTGSGSAQRGYKVIVPVDCMSSEDPYMEQYAAWHMFKGGPAIVTSQTTLTRSDMIKF